MKPATGGRGLRQKGMVNEAVYLQVCLAERPTYHVPGELPKCAKQKYTQFGELLLCPAAHAKVNLVSGCGTG